MIQAAKANVVGPAVAAKDKLVLLGRIICVFQEIGSRRLGVTLQRCRLQCSDQCLGRLRIGSSVLIGVQPSLGFVRHRGVQQLLGVHSQPLADLLLCQ